MHYQFAIVHKNQYPYRTLHTEGCSRLARAKWTESIGDAKIGNLDTIRMDYCPNCVGKRQDDNPSPALRYLWARQREAQEQRRAENIQEKTARYIAALRVALAKAEDAANEATLTRADALEKAYRDGAMTPPEVYHR